ncbi:MAG: ChaN family lipoprotein [Cyanobacteria bacterium P01_G01_bin.19]
MKLKFLRLAYFLSAVAIGFLAIAYPYRSIALAEVSQVSEPIELSQLEQNDVIYLGENHDNPEHHERQLAIIQQLDRDSHLKPIAIGMEMFQRPFQPILDSYLANQITEAELKEQTEFDRRWGFDWEFYAPILRYAKTNEISLLALNTPAEITQKVATTGIDSLQGSDFRYIPPIDEIQLDNAAYRQAVEEVYLEHVEEGQSNSADFDNFFAAQILWDETMADAIAFYYQNNPQSQIVVLVGKAHVMEDYAIPDRVNRRISDPGFSSIIYLQ